MKRIVAFVLALFVVFSTLPVTASAASLIESGKCGTNARYKLYSDGLLSITGSGEINVMTGTTRPWYKNRTVVKTVQIGNGITKIGVSSFEGCSNLTSVTIPNSVTEIQSSAFWNCDSLQVIDIPDGVTKISSSAFGSCDSLTGITIPGGVKEIGIGAFSGCKSLVSVTLMDGIEKIDSDAFSGCSSLTSITIPDSVTDIRGSAFNNCSSLTNVTLSNNINTIRSYTFNGCTSLETINIPDMVTEIGTKAFQNCANLKSISIPGNISLIGNSAFDGCGSLSTIYFKGNAPLFGENPFQGVTANAYYPSDNTSWTADKLQQYGGTLIWVPFEGSTSNICGDHLTWEVTDDVKLVISGYGDMYDFQLSPWFSYYETLTSAWISEGATSIGAHAFIYCINLSQVTIPEGITSIGNNAFYGTNLTYVDIPDSVVLLDNACFENCDSLVSVTIPRNVTRVGSFAFGSCDALKEIRFLGDVPELGTLIFEDITATAYYPAGNTTWTEDKLQNYGGAITWVPYDGGYEPTVKWSTISTSLGGNIAMNFYVELSENLVSDPDAYIQFTFAGRTVKVSLSQGKPSDKNGVTVYQFSCPITSKNMTDEITAQVYNASGAVGDPKSMSVDTYCNWVIANFKDEKTVNLMKGMLNYGASAQKLFKYRTDDLANASLAEEDKVFGAVDASAYKHSVVGTEEGIIAKSMTLLLDSETTVRVYFELTGDKPIEEFTFTVDGVEVTPTYKDGKYYIERPNISAHKLDDMHVFTCGGITVTYGGLSYVNQVMTYYTSGTTFDMASALYAYSKAAEAYID